MSKGTYLRRKEQGLCVRCGNEIELERKGKTTCFACLKKDSERAQNLRDSRSALGLCPRCGKVKLMGSERNCPECSAYNYIHRNEQRKKYPEREAIIRIHSNENRRKKRSERKALGLCVICGKPLKSFDTSYVTCIYCRKKTDEYLRLYRQGGAAT